MTIQQLFPTNGKRPLQNLYLSHNLRQYAAQNKRPFVYANFVSSVDARIAIPHPSRPGMMVPQTIANARDWRLFQELAAQADLIISSGRYLRDWADGRAQEILRVDDPAFADLRQWRKAQGLAPQPDLAIISSSLNFPIPATLTENGRRVIIFTTAKPDPARVAEIEAQVGNLYVVGEKSVSGGQLVQKMVDLGYQTVYSAAGPRILHLLLAENVLNRLYLTQVSRLLGGSPFSSILEGDLLETAVNLKLHTMYYDPEAIQEVGQLLLAYNVSNKP
ncbi:2,5-diamino-6-ribosylamino-pyrimidinone 5-phosphate reductase homolog [hydrothermal vent metagenome]|uniref:2,5-diamino-6-ribosylamino-pyrimidinone 5-phosphate reductase homolog n=1 Tax=hydrothermal vent metagenome TaxID=652676 RepID=A0A3B0VZW8_9ZZZZ